MNWHDLLKGYYPFLLKATHTQPRMTGVVHEREGRTIAHFAQRRKRVRTQNRREREKGHNAETEEDPTSDEYAVLVSLT
jgi:hypothetical protein